MSGTLYVLVYLTLVIVLWVSVQFSRSVKSDSLRPHGLQHTRPPCPSPTPRIYSYSCPSSWWCHPTISSSVVPFSHLHSCPASGSFQMSQLRASGDQSFSISVSPSSEYWGLISFRMDWLDLLAVQSMETLILQMRSQTLKNTSKVTQLWSSRALIFNFQVLSSFSEIKFSLFYLLNKNNIKSNISLSNINNMSADFLTKPAKTGFSDYLNFCQFI